MHRRAGRLTDLGHVRVIECCPDLLPDLWRLVDDFDVALEELLDCAVPARV